MTYCPTHPGTEQVAASERGNVFWSVFAFKVPRSPSCLVNDALKKAAQHKCSPACALVLLLPE